MIVLNFRRYVRRQTPCWQQDRLYLGRWWTPFCRLKRCDNPELARIARDWDCKAETFVWLKRWWRRR